MYRIKVFVDSENLMDFQKLIDSGLNEHIIKQIKLRLGKENHQYLKNKPYFINLAQEQYFFLKKTFNGYRVSTVLNTLAVVLSKKSQKETELGKLLFKKSEGWQREIITKAGRIDGLNKKTKQIVELKFLDGWKSALGQVLAYKASLGIEYSDYTLEIWLLLKTSNKCSSFGIIREFCGEYGVTVRFISAKTLLFLI